MKSSKHPEWLPASLAFLITRDLRGGRGPDKLARRSPVHPPALPERAGTGTSDSWLLIHAQSPRLGPRLESLGKDATSAA